MKVANAGMELTMIATLFSTILCVLLSAKLERLGLVLELGPDLHANEQAALYPGDVVGGAEAEAEHQGDYARDDTPVLHYLI
jgi:hypothetical protein